MTRWCPICEGPGRPVVQGTVTTHDAQALRSGAAVRVRERIPGISPSHMCTRCPTFFGHRDRFYLTARHETSTYGIAVRPHRRARLRIELVDDGLGFLFPDGSWILLPDGDFPKILSDYFSGYQGMEIIGWSSRRGFDVRLTTLEPGALQLKVDPPGPRFPLLVAKTWARDNELRRADHCAETLSVIGAHPVVFTPTGRSS